MSAEKQSVHFIPALEVHRIEPRVVPGCWSRVLQRTRSSALNVADETAKMSFISVDPDSHFPIQNLPYGVFSTEDNVSILKNDDSLWMLWYIVDGLEVWPDMTL